tara:strand:- start:135 stop:683 length:549 start_codon:yes stop_codon:yes gene_type:complete
MANYRLTDKSALNENPASDDKLMLVDTSDTSSSSAGTSKQIDNKFLITTIKTSLSNANIQALDDDGAGGSSFELVPPQGSGFAIVPLQVSVFTNYSASAESSNSNLYVGFNPVGTAWYWCFFSRIMNGLTTSNTYIQSTPISSASGVNPATIDNVKLSVWANNNFNGGWSADIYTTFTVIKL